MAAPHKRETADVPWTTIAASFGMAVIAAVGFGRWRRGRAEACNPGTAARREGEGDVRSAGPEGMRSKPKREWTATDQASDESFPASDQPGNY